MEPAAEAEQDFEGNFVSAPPMWVLHSKCRDDVNGSGKTKQLANGENIIYAGIVYMPKSAGIIPENRETMVSKELLDNPQLLSDVDAVKQLRSEGKLRLSGTVKGFDESRLNIRIWL